MKKIIKLLTLVFILLLTSCQSNPLLEGNSDGMITEAELLEQNKSDDKVYYKDFRIALISPITGSRAKLGKSVANATTMSLYEHLNNRIKIYNFNSYSNNAGAIVAMKQALRIKPHVILTVFADEAEAIYPLAQKYNIPIVALSNDKEIARDNLYVLGFVPEQTIDQITKWALNNDYRNFAAILPQNKYGHVVKDYYETILAEKYITPIVKLVDINFNIKIDDFRNYFKQIYDKSSGGKVAILLPENFLNNQQILQEIKQYDNINILLVNQTDEMYEKYQKENLNLVFASGNLAVYNNFNKDYNKNFHEHIQRNNTIAYDFVSLIDIMLNNYPNMGLKEYLQRIELQGIDGMINFKSDNIAQRKFEIYQISGGKITKQ